MAEILVLGGKFGGLAAAHELRKSLGDEHAVTVVDSSDRFYVGFAKLWELGNTRSLDSGTRSLSALEGKGIRYLQSEITEIDAPARRVSTLDGDLTADYLVVALGAVFAFRDEGFKGGHNLYDPEHVPELREELENLQEGKVVVAILGLPYKCPPAPFEAAFVVDELVKRTGRKSHIEMSVYTPQPSPLPVAGPEASKRIAAKLEERGIGLFPEHKAVSSDDRAIVFQDGSKADFDVALCVPGHVAPPVVAASGLAGANGWIEPDPRTLRTKFEGVYAVGDCTAIQMANGNALPKAGVFAEAQGVVAARNIAAEITGSAEATFDGHGYCFLDWSDGRASYVQGDFFAEPKPQVSVSEPDEATLKAKETFERERLEAWF